ncbi:hypothetical protein [Jiangella endophytica]|uniref:hypothetical protein n=1 Tax=Jiangella endophytica TaxID=1623398 RepID=UPI0018E50AD4|nr:hypothetical protein [Jiangella endophytica]
MLPRRFALVRHVDYTGVSGVGVVAYGVVFADGHVALRWASANPATSLWSSLDDLVAVHGHGDATSIEWLDPVSDPFAQPIASRGAGRRARRVQPSAVVPEPVVEPDGTRETRPIEYDPEPDPEPAAPQAEPDPEPEPSPQAEPDPEPEPVDPEPAAVHPEPTVVRPEPAVVRPEPAVVRPEPAVRPEPGRPDGVRPELLGPGLPHPEPLQPRSPAEPASPAEPPPQPQPALPSAPATPTDAVPPPPPPADPASTNGGRPGHIRLPSQRGAGRHRRSTPPTQSRATLHIESDGS